MKSGFVWLMLAALTGFSPLARGQARLPARDAREIRIGSKNFTESYILAEWAAQVIERGKRGRVARQFGLGGTGVLYEALKAGEIDVYPEYTGTIAQAILKNPGVRTHVEIARALIPLGLAISPPLGFENTYALAVPRAFATAHGLTRVSDLARVSDLLRPGFSHEFTSRADGTRPLLAHYGLILPGVQAMDHALAYRATEKGEINLLDVYSTDAKIKSLDLTVLADDRGFFPAYQAVFLTRSDVKGAEIQEFLNPLFGAIAPARMIALNHRVDEERATFQQAVAEGVFGKAGISRTDEWVTRLWRRTHEHFALVAWASLFALVVGIPLGVLSARAPRLGQLILVTSGLIQTIPALALLCFLIPLFGIGEVSALVALFLYGLLPVVTGTMVGLRSIDPVLIEMSRSLGLSSPQSLLRIELPLASRQILAGVRTSVIITIGTTTLAALIGAGGYGAIILAGLAINDMSTVAAGAIPATIMALLFSFLFLALERILIPRGLRD